MLSPFVHLNTGLLPEWPHVGQDGRSHRQNCSRWPRNDKALRVGLLCYQCMRLSQLTLLEGTQKYIVIHSNSLFYRFVVRIKKASFCVLIGL